MIYLSKSVSTKSCCYKDRKSITFIQDSNNGFSSVRHAHAGTHIDFQSHSIKNGKTLIDYPNELIYKNVVVCDLADNSAFSSDPSVDAVILRTGVSEKDYVWNSPVISVDFLNSMVKAFPQMGCLFLDCISLTSQKNPNEGKAAHQFLLSRDILIVEDCDLSRVVNSISKVLVKIHWRGIPADGSPVSVVAL